MLFLLPPVSAADPDPGKERQFAEVAEKEKDREKTSLSIEAGKAEAYIHEKLSLRIKLSMAGVRVQDVQYPRLINENFSFQEFSPPVHQSEWVDGILCETLEFRTTFSGRKAGVFKIGPARLALTLLTARRGDGSREDYFGSYQTRPLLLQSEEISVRILSLPESGKPKDFHYAVGHFTFRTEADPRELRVGEPLRLKMTVEGKGNLETLAPPQISDPGGFKLYSPQKRRTEGGVIFEQVLIPQSESLREIPAIYFSFFDPEKKTYRLLKEGPIPIRVGSRDREESLISVPSSGGGPLGRDIIAIKYFPGAFKPSGVFLYHHPFFWGGQFILLLLLIGARIYLKQRERMRTDMHYSARRRASRTVRRRIKEVEGELRREGGEFFYDQLFYTLRGYLRDRFLIPQGDITPQEISERLSSQAMDRLWREKLEKILAECELARYGASEFDLAAKEKIFRAMQEWVRHFEKEKP
jgi:hypothetical protein